ncbi:MAG: non-canonical purine NTP pyrophosphatase, partial [Spirochaetales bacterium]
MDILLASGNQHKLNELAPLLAPHKLHLPFEFGIDFDCEETGSTFEENALMKAKKLLQDSQGLTDMSVLADDSGLLVDALPGELGVHTARFGSPDGVTILPAETKNLMLIDRMRGLKGDQRKAEFVCVLVLMDRKGKTITVKGVSEGRILEEPDGIGGFGYDPVFYNNEAGCSNAALGKDKGKFSHRGKAVRLLMEKLNEKAIPTRDQIAESDKWDLADLYATEADYEKDLEILKKNVKKADSFKGTLGKSPQALLDCLKYSNDNTMLLEKLYNYASLNNSAEAQNPKNQKRLGKLMHLYSEFVSSISWMDPEI